MGANQQLLLAGGIISPNLVPGLIRWWKGNDTSAGSMTLDGGTGRCTVWIDQAGVAGVAQATTTLAPLPVAAQQNGLGTLYFDGARFMTNVAGVALRAVAGWSIYSVQKAAVNTVQMTTLNVEGTAGSARAVGFSARVTTGYMFTGGRRNNADAFGNCESTTQISTSAYTYAACIGDYTNTVCELWVNGSSVKQQTSWLTAGSTPGTEGQIYVGDSPAGTSKWNGYIGEILMYDRAHNTTQRQSVENYLAAKWAL